MKKLLFISLILLCVYTTLLDAQIPKRFSWQGIVTDNSGAKLNGQYTLDMSIYNVETSGVALWAGSQTLTINDGLVNVIVGDSSALNLDFEQEYWLEIAIENDTLNRVRLTAVPYSIISKTVEDNAITTEKIATAEVHGNAAGFQGDIAPNSIGTSDIATNAVTTNEVGFSQISGSAAAKDHILDLSIDTPDLAKDAVDQVKLAPLAVSGDASLGGDAEDNIIDNSVGQWDLMPNSIVGDAQNGLQPFEDNIVDNSIGQNDLMPKSVSGSKALASPTIPLAFGEDNIIDESIDQNDIATDAIRADEIKDGEVKAAEIADGTVVRSIGEAAQLTDHVRLVEGANITIEDNTPNPNDIRISAIGDQNFVTNIYFVNQAGDTIVVISNDTTIINNKIYIKGKSYHEGTEFFWGGLEHPLEGGGVVRIDSSGLVVKDGAGDTVAVFNKDGSYHEKKETYKADIVRESPDGSKTTIGEDGTTHSNPDGSETTKTGPGGTEATKTNEDGSSTTTSTSPNGTTTKDTDDQGQETTITKIGKDDSGNGVIEIYDKDGNLIYKVDSNGSYHNVPEFFNNGIYAVELNLWEWFFGGDGGYIKDLATGEKIIDLSGNPEAGEGNIEVNDNDNQTDKKTKIDGKGTVTTGNDGSDRSIIGTDDNDSGEIVIRDENGEIIFKVDKNGSLHNVPETYNKEIIQQNDNGTNYVIGPNGIIGSGNEGGTAQPRIQIGDGLPASSVNIERDKIIIQTGDGSTEINPFQIKAGFDLDNPSYVLPLSGEFQTNSNIIAQGFKAFRIDHPELADKYLVHAAIESNEVLNKYSGTVTTGSDSLATVTLPDYFDNVNTDFRYQLTIIGTTFARAIVFSEISNNEFTIKTDEPNIKVSWEVTARRNDQYIIDNPFEDEPDK